jgi:hypothetical protein
MQKVIEIKYKDWLRLTSGLSGAEVSELFDSYIKTLFNNNEVDRLSDDIKNKIKQFDCVINLHKGQEDVSHWNWKGGITPENNKIRSSSDYIKWRKFVFLRDKYTCQSCFTKGGKLNAHHIVYFSKNKELRLEKTNGITLCTTCHKKIHKNK